MRFFAVILAFLFLDAAGHAEAQDGGTDSVQPDAPEVDPAIRRNATRGEPVQLEISRRFLKNFLVDEQATALYAREDGELRDLHGAFTVGSPGARYVAIWDPTTARLVGVLDLEAPPEEVPESSTLDEDEKVSETPSTPYVLRASGPPPFEESPGAFDEPEFFGFRVEAGRPIFLYLHGSLIVEESVWFEEGGAVLVQHFSFREPANDVLLQIPESWVPLAEVDSGELDGAELRIPKEAATDFAISFRLETKAPATEEVPE